MLPLNLRAPRMRAPPRVLNVPGPESVTPPGGAPCVMFTRSELLCEHDTRHSPTWPLTPMLAHPDQGDRHRTEALPATDYLLDESGEAASRDGLSS